MFFCHLLVSALPSADAANSEGVGHRREVPAGDIVDAELVRVGQLLVQCWHFKPSKADLVRQRGLLCVYLRRDVRGITGTGIFYFAFLHTADLTVSTELSNTVHQSCRDRLVLYECAALN